MHKISDLSLNRNYLIILKLVIDIKIYQLKNIYLL